VRANANLTTVSSGAVTQVRRVGYQNDGGSTVRALTTDSQGNVYIVGESSGSPESGIAPNVGYIAKFNPSDQSVTVQDYNDYNDIFEVHSANGWVYIMGIRTGSIFDGYVGLSRLDTTLANVAADKDAFIGNGDYSGMINDSDGKKFKFSMSATL
jgi:hypothetical protein